MLKNKNLDSFRISVSLLVLAVCFTPSILFAQEIPIENGTASEEVIHDPIDEAPTPPPPPPADEEPIDLPDIVIVPDLDSKPPLSNETVAGNEVLVNENTGNSLQGGAVALQPQPAPPQGTPNSSVRAVFAQASPGPEPAPVLGTASTAEQISTESLLSRDPEKNSAFEAPKQGSGKGPWFALGLIALFLLLGFAFFSRFRV